MVIKLTDITCFLPSVGNHFGYVQRLSMVRLMQCSRSKKVGGALLIGLSNRHPDIYGA